MGNRQCVKWAGRAVVLGGKVRSSGESVLTNGLWE